jgi:two-component system cell cycle response regulator CpdR
MARILLTEDDESVCTFVKRALEMDGHEIMTAKDGAEGLSLLQGENGAFDLLLTDIKMPVMDGIALALAVARDYPKLTILLMTGYADQRERAANLKALIHDVITKPFTLPQIRAKVGEALKSRAA